MKHIGVICMLLFFLVGCSQKPNCDDDVIVGLVVDIAKEETRKSLYIMDEKEIDKFKENFEIELDHFMTHSSKNDKLTKCTAEYKTLYKENNHRGTGYIDYTARYTDDGEQVYVKVLKIN